MTERSRIGAREPSQPPLLSLGRPPTSFLRSMTGNPPADRASDTQGILAVFKSPGVTEQRHLLAQYSVERKTDKGLICRETAPGTQFRSSFLLPVPLTINTSCVQLLTVLYSIDSTWTGSNCLVRTSRYSSFDLPLINSNGSSRDFSFGCRPAKSPIDRLVKWSSRKSKFDRKRLRPSLRRDIVLEGKSYRPNHHWVFNSER